MIPCNSLPLKKKKEVKLEWLVFKVALEESET